MRAIPYRQGVGKRKDLSYKYLTKVHDGVFTASNGRLFGHLRGMTVVKLTTTGRKSGLERSTMLTSPIAEPDRIVLVASYYGDPRHPAWYLNLQAHPEVHALTPDVDIPMQARTLVGDERAALWAEVIATQPRYANYQSKTDRELPLVVLTPS